MLKVKTAKNAWFITIGLHKSVIEISTIKRVDCPCIMYSISKSEAIHLLENVLLEDLGTYKKNIISLLFFFFYFFCLVYIKWLIVWTSVSL